jgi:hypothetical protein
MSKRLLQHGPCSAPVCYEFDQIAAIGSIAATQNLPERNHLDHVC